MGKRLDYVAEALEALRGAGDGRNFATDAPQIASVHAILALVEQQRIANLIALANMELATVSTEALKCLARVDNDGLLASEIHGLQPDIAAALGLGVGDE